MAAMSQGDAGIVHTHDRAGAGRDRLCGRVGIEIERVGADVREDRRRAPQRHRVGTGNKGESGHDDFVAGAELGKQCRKFEPGGRRVREMDLRRLQSCGEPGLAAARERPVARKMALLQCLTHVIEFATDDHRLAETDFHHDSY